MSTSALGLEGTQIGRESMGSHGRTSEKVACAGVQSGGRVTSENRGDWVKGSVASSRSISVYYVDQA